MWTVGVKDPLGETRQRRVFQKSLSLKSIAWFSMFGLFVLALGGCNEKSGGNNGEESVQPTATTVTIAALVDDGDAMSPIADASCRFIERNGEQSDQVQTDSTGAFRLQVSPEQQGFIHCTLPGFRYLGLSTFVSTVGKVAGDTIPEAGLEEVSPRTTVVAMLLAQEASDDLQARKEDLLSALGSGEPTLTTLTEAAEELFLALQEGEIDVIFSDSAEGGEDANNDGSSTDEGATGAVGDGAEFSPILNAVCSFAQEVQGETLVVSVLHDLFVHGRVERPDLQAIAEQVNQALAGCSTAIMEAFATLFPLGLGHPLQTVASGANATYFLPVPAGVPGFVRCYPPNQQDLILVTFVEARQAGARLTGQDVTPFTTVFGAHMAPLLQETLSTTEGNYLADISGLEVGITQVNGSITGFEMLNAFTLRDAQVGWVAFAAGALYNALFKQAINADYLPAMRGLVIQGLVDPTLLTEGLSVSRPEAEAVAQLVNSSINAAALQLGADPQVAISTAHIDVRVQEQGSGRRLPGATVELLNTTSMPRCTNCPAVTQQDGEVTLTLADTPKEQAVVVTIRASLEGFTDKTIMRNVLAVTRISVEMNLSP